jgi:bifunctional DNA-binding transcriptional regulator/antitoxin component of YhaV-PrlF toxin-antitoxin module
MLTDGHGKRSGAILTLTSKKESVMRITSKGQVTIPQQMREEAGLLPHTEVDFVLEPDGVRIIKAHPTKKPGRGRMIVERLRGKATISMTTDEIMALTRGEE